MLSCFEHESVLKKTFNKTKSHQDSSFLLFLLSHLGHAPFLLAKQCLKEKFNLQKSSHFVFIIHLSLNILRAICKMTYTNTLPEICSFWKSVPKASISLKHDTGDKLATKVYNTNIMFTMQSH